MPKIVGFALIVLAVVLGLIALVNGAALALNLATWISEGSYRALLMRSLAAVVTTYLSYRAFVTGKRKVTSATPSGNSR
jgi:hypothetical protein